jgi:exonuclease III
LIICIQESKIENVSSQLVVDACGPNFRDHLAVPSVGASGGMLIAWNEDVVHLDLVASNQHFMLVCYQSKITGESWYLENVYGPQEIAHKLAFLADLKDAVEHYLALPLALLGDFNLISEAKVTTISTEGSC